MLPATHSHLTPRLASEEKSKRTENPPETKAWAGPGERPTDETLKTSTDWRQVLQLFCQAPRGHVGRTFRRHKLPLLPTLPPSHHAFPSGRSGIEPAVARRIADRLDRVPAAVQEQELDRSRKRRTAGTSHSEKVAILVEAQVKKVQKGTGAQGRFPAPFPFPFPFPFRNLPRGQFRGVCLGRDDPNIPAATPPPQ